jgi:hypothetical protein
MTFRLIQLVEIQAFGHFFIGIVYNDVVDDYAIERDSGLLSLLWHPNNKQH